MFAGLETVVEEIKDREAFDEAVEALRDAMNVTWLSVLSNQCARRKSPVLMLHQAQSSKRCTQPLATRNRKNAKAYNGTRIEGGRSTSRIQKVVTGSVRETFGTRRSLAASDGKSFKPTRSPMARSDSSVRGGLRVRGETGSLR